jgi:prepilin-type processing-associated H-X9-DG protein
MNIEKAFAKIDDEDTVALPSADVSKVDSVVVIAPVPASAPAIEQAAIELGRARPNGLWKYFDREGNLLFCDGAVERRRREEAQVFSYLLGPRCRWRRTLRIQTSE